MSGHDMAEEDATIRSTPPCALCADPGLGRFDLSAMRLGVDKTMSSSARPIINRSRKASAERAAVEEIEEVLCHLGMEHPDLEVVDLSFFSCCGTRSGGGDHLVRALVRSRLLRQCRQLRELRLCGCGIAGDTVRKLIDDIAALRWNEWEERAATSGEVKLGSGLDLHLSNNPLMSPESVMALGRLIAGPRGSARYIRRLHLDGVPLTAESALVLCEAVAIDPRIEELHICIPANVLDRFDDREHVVGHDLLSWTGPSSRRGAKGRGGGSTKNHDDEDGCGNGLLRSLGRNHYALRSLHIDVGAKNHKSGRHEVVTHACRAIIRCNEAIAKDGYHLGRHEACLSVVELQKLRSDDDQRQAGEFPSPLSLRQTPPPVAHPNLGCPMSDVRRSAIYSAIVASAAGPVQWIS